MHSNIDDSVLYNGVPPLEWPVFSDEKSRLSWWHSCVQAWLTEWGKPAPVVPIPPEDLQALEQRLGCALPFHLRTYHEKIGVLELAETLCSVIPKKNASIEPLYDAYHGITDILESVPEANQLKTLIDQLVVFGDYLGNGNLWCFHRETGEVWYFDHDTSPMLTQIFTDVGEYLDALMFKCLLEIHGEEENETVLRERLGDAVVEKWMY